MSTEKLGKQSTRKQVKICPKEKVLPSLPHKWRINMDQSIIYSFTFLKLSLEFGLGLTLEFELWIG